MTKETLIQDLEETYIYDTQDAYIRHIGHIYTSKETDIHDKKKTIIHYQKDENTQPKRRTEKNYNTKQKGPYKYDKRDRYTRQRRPIITTKKMKIRIQRKRQEKTTTQKKKKPINTTNETDTHDRRDQ